MTITSKGYTGSVDNVDWAKLSDKLGAQYSVFGEGSFRVLAAPGDRAVYVSPGEASGQGIVDLSDERVTLNSPVVSSGNRWDLVALRREWGTKKKSTLVMLQGDDVRRLPASRQNIIGEVVDHPLCLVRFVAGQTVAQELIDLRVWHGNGGLVARDDHVLPFLDRIGTVVRIDDTTFTRHLDFNGQPVWSANRLYEIGGVVGEFGNSWNPYFGFGWEGVRWWIKNGMATVYGAATNPFPWKKDTAICKLPAPCLPDFKFQGVNCQVLPDGNITVGYDGGPNPDGSPGAVSFSATFPIA